MRQVKLPAVRFRESTDWESRAVARSFRPGRKSLDERPKPEIAQGADAVVRIARTTICGTDLHILKGDVATCGPGRTLGHEGAGVVEAVGGAVTLFKPGDHVLLSCITS